MTDVSGQFSIEDVDPRRWSALTGSFPAHNYESSVVYAQAMAARSKSVARFMTVHSGRELIGGAAVRIRKIPFLGRGVAYISGGPFVSCNEAGLLEFGRLAAVASAIRHRLVERERNVLLLRAAAIREERIEHFDSSFASMGFLKSSHVRSYRTIMIDLTIEDKQLRAGLHSKWRNCLNLAGRSGLSVESGSSRELAGRFLPIFHAMQDSKEFSVKMTPEFFFNLDMQNTGAVIFIARKDGRDVGGHVLSLLGNTAVYLFGATNEAGRDAKSGYQLQWSAMMLAKQRGFAWYDLGGIDRQSNPGGFQFKNRMGGTVFQSPGPYQCLPEGLLFRAIDRLLSLR